MKRLSPTLLSLIAYALTACVASTTSVQPLTIDGDTYLVEKREQKIHDLAENAHRNMLTKGVLYSDIAANQYLNRVGTSLVPNLAGHAPEFNFFIVKNASINAFAMPNGNIYLHAGLLASLSNEAQLAHVLAHEIAHVVQRHSYIDRIDTHNTVVAAHVADLLLFGTGLAYIPAGMNLASYSRDQEEESDTLALKYVAAKNYNVRESIKLFQQLNEVKHTKETASVWSSHPLSSSRYQHSLDSIEKSHTMNDNGIINQEIYEEFRQLVARLSIDRRISAQQYELAEDAVLREASVQKNDSIWQYYLGEIYRLKSRYPEDAAKEHAWLYDKKNTKELKQSFLDKIDSDHETAMTHYQNALTITPNVYKIHRGLGLLHLQANNFSSAKYHLNQYSNQLEKPKDWRYISSLITKIEKE